MFFWGQRSLWLARIKDGTIKINGALATPNDTRRFTYQNLEHGIWMEYTGKNPKSYNLKIQ